MVVLTKGRSIRLIGMLLVAILFLPALAFTDYIKLSSPPDVNKKKPDNSCWLATAANMLAAAGYGSEGTVQANAESIYVDLMDSLGTGP